MDVLKEQIAKIKSARENKSGAPKQSFFKQADIIRNK